MGAFTRAALARRQLRRAPHRHHAPARSAQCLSLDPVVIRAHQGARQRQDGAGHLQRQHRRARGQGEPARRRPRIAGRASLSRAFAIPQAEIWRPRTVGRRFAEPSFDQGKEPMNPSTSSTATTTTTASAFTLEAPEVITPVPATQVQDAVPLKPEVVQAVDDQVTRFIDALMHEDLHSDAFRAKLDSAFALGREEISTASALMQNRFMQANFVGMEDSPAYKAIAEIRGLLDDLNPGNQGDLLQKNKLLGIIPYGNKLQAYFRKYQSAS